MTEIGSSATLMHRQAASLAARASRFAPGTISLLPVQAAKSIPRSKWWTLFQLPIKKTARFADAGWEGPNNKRRRKSAARLRNGVSFDLRDAASLFQRCT